MSNPTTSFQSLNVITHSGAFHADEVLAVALLSLILDKKPTLIRTRDESLIEQGKEDPNTYVLDVGGEYDEERLCFDHHQRDFDITNSYGNKMSTFGLIVEHLSGHYTSGVLDQLREFANMVDSQDNGIQTYPELYWLAEMNALDDFDMVLYMATHWLKAKLAKWSAYEKESKVIEEALASAVDGVVASETEFLPVDERLNQHPKLKLVVYPSKSGGYTIQSLNKGVKKDFTMRCPAPVEWRGLRNKELVEASGVEGMIFCHAGGFLTVVDDFPTALEVAQLIVLHNEVE